MSRIWCMTHQLDGGMTWAFFATKVEAERAGRAAVADHLDDNQELEPGDPATPLVEPFEVSLTKAGMAKALNDLISWGCLNEH